MSRRIEFQRPRRQAKSEVLREGETYSQDFVFVVLGEDGSRWDRLKTWILYRLGRIHPPG